MSKLLPPTPQASQISSSYNGDNPYFNYAMVSPDGILYEDTFIQIGFESHFHKQSGRLVLYYGNLTIQPISNINTTIFPMNSIATNIQIPPQVIEPRRQAQQIIDFTCLSDFIDFPTLQINYVAAGRPFNHSIRLPIVATKFVQPLHLTAPQFLKSWAETTSEKQQVVDTGAPPSVPYVVQLLAEGFHLSVIPNEGSSWNVNNVVAAGLFTCATKQFPVLLRMEVSPTTFLYRLTIRTPSPILTASIMAILSVILGKPTSL